MYFLVFAFENTKKQFIFLCICQSDSLKVLRSSAMVNSISVSTLGFKACFIKMSEKKHQMHAARQQFIYLSAMCNHTHTD